MAEPTHNTRDQIQSPQARQATSGTCCIEIVPCQCSSVTGRRQCRGYQATLAIVAFGWREVGKWPEGESRWKGKNEEVSIAKTIEVGSEYMGINTSLTPAPISVPSSAPWSGFLGTQRNSLTIHLSPMNPIFREPENGAYEINGAARVNLPNQR